MKKLLLFLGLVTQFVFSQSTDDYVREWGTYFPQPRDSALEEEGYLWVIGDIHANSAPYFNNLITEDAHQDNYMGGKELYIAKISPQGNVLYASFFGGGQDEVPYGIEVKNNYVYIVGSTTSTNNITTPASFDNVLEQNYSPNQEPWGRTAGFLAKFTEQGQLVWSTYIQGNISTGSIYSIAVSDNDEIYLWGTTKSTNMATEGSFRATIPEPSYNEFTESYEAESYPFLMKMNSSGNLVWSTYYGPNDANVIPEGNVVVDDFGDIYLCGRTEDTENYYGTPNTHQPETGGGSRDTFFSKFDSSGNRIWSTYYGGSGSEVAPFLHIGKNGLFYITGLTTSSNNISTAGVFQENLINPLANYLVMFNSNGQRIWGTYFNIGENGGSFATPCFANIDGEILVSGRTSSNTNTATEGSWQESYGGGDTDAYVVKFNSDASDVTWGTYFGGTGLEFPFQGGMQLTAEDQFYICGLTTSYNAEAIASEGAIEDHGSIGAGVYSGYLAKFVQLSELSVSNLRQVELSVWPNPASSLVVVNGLDGFKNYKLDVYDIQGRLILQSENKNVVKIENLTSGRYFMKINANGFYENLSFLVK